MKVVNLSENAITCEGFDYLLKNVVNHPSLEKLHLRGNFIEDKALELIRKNSSKFKKLKFFNLKDNKIKDSKLNQKHISVLNSKGIIVVLN